MTARQIIQLGLAFILLVIGIQGLIAGLSSDIGWKKYVGMVGFVIILILFILTIYNLWMNISKRKQEE